MSFEYQNFKTEITPRQRQAINAYKFGKKKINNTQVYAKKKYWCPILHDWYQAMPHHFHCKLCWNDVKGDLHEVIEYNPEIHKEIE